MRGTATSAIVSARFLHGGHNLWVLRQAKVIIAAKGDVGFTVYPHLGALGRLQHTALAVEVLPVALSKAGRQGMV